MDINESYGRSTKIVNFMTPGSVILLLERVHVNHMGEMLHFFKILFFIANRGDGAVG